VVISVLAGFALAVALALVVPVVSRLTIKPALAAVPSDQVAITVSGTLRNMTSNPSFGPPGSPTAFSPSTFDYAIYCKSGVNNISLSFAGVTPASATVSLGENQAAVVQASNGQYWIRCLPHDFPVMHFSGSGSEFPGYYLTGNLAGGGSVSPYVMVLNSYGTPVWYRKSPGGAINIEATAPNTIAWMTESGPGIGTEPSVGYNLYNLASQTSQTLKAPVGPTDFHELYPMINGDYMMIGTPVKELSTPFEGYKAIVDCVVQEVNSQGVSVWSWTASDHVALDETVHPSPIAEPGGITALDVFHCNSVDVNQTTGQVLVSMRDVSAVLLIQRLDSSGALDQDGPIIWRLNGCGNGKPGLDTTEQILQIPLTGPGHDPEQCFDAQHDARFQPNGDITVYDDHSYGLGPNGSCPGATSCYARGVEYAPHPTSSPPSASWVSQFPGQPSGQNSFATGSFRRYDGGADNLVGWGVRFEPCPNNPPSSTCKQGTTRSGFTEFDATGKQIFSMYFPNGEIVYRAVKVPLATFDIDLLRATAGLPRASYPTVGWGSLGGALSSKPAVAAWSPTRLDAFGRGLDGAVWHKAWVGTTWSGWQSLGGLLLPGTGPAVASSAPGRLDVFVTGTDHQLWHDSWNGTIWSGWQPLGGYLTSSPAASSRGPGLLDVAADGGDHAIWHRAYAGSWLGWESLGGLTSADPGIASSGGGQVDVFAMGTDHQLWQRTFQNGAWQLWGSLSGNLTSGPSATFLPNGLVDVVAAGSGGVPERLSFNGAWGLWQPLGGLTGLPPSVVPFNGGENVFVTGTDTALWFGSVSSIGAT
jgi:hypothetical protein